MSFVPHLHGEAFAQLEAKVRLVPDESPMTAADAHGNSYNFLEDGYLLVLDSD